MSHFLQLHYLTVYPPSRPNRGEAGRPKSAYYGGATRLRDSSQSLKRAVRMSDIFQDALEGKLGTRSRMFGDQVYRHLVDKGADEDPARKIATRIASMFGKHSGDDGNSRISQLAFISPDERQAALELAESVLKQGEIDDKQVKAALGQVLRTADSAVDLAMFGRMLADSPAFNRQAAVQVAHAITTHAAPEEEDLYRAIDDLGDGAAAFLGKSGYGSGVFYKYVVVEVTRLLDNLDGDRDLARTAISTLARAFALVSPSGGRTAFAHHVRASYGRAEAGPVQPRSLASAFLKPVTGDDLLAGSITCLRMAAANLDKVYGPAADAICEMDVTAAEGSLEEFASFAGDQVQHA